MKRNKKPLKLDVETIRALDSEALKKPVGGAYTAATYCLNGNCAPHNSDVGCTV